MAKRPRDPLSRSRKPRKPRSARKSRQIGGKGSIVMSFYRNTWAQIEAAARHQLLRLPDGWSLIDPQRADRNRTLVGSGDIRQDIQAFEQTIEIRGHRRDSAVPYLTLVLGASPEFFRPKGGPPGSEIDDPEDAERLEAWIDANMDWAHDHFGTDLVSAHYNGDESTPHIHLAIVPTYARHATIKPRRKKGESAEEHDARVQQWTTTPTVRTRSWASNAVVGRNDSARLIREEYAAAMAPMGLQYSLASYDPDDPDDPVSRREYQDFLEAEAEQRRANAAMLDQMAIRTTESLDRQAENLRAIIAAAGAAIAAIDRGEEPEPLAGDLSALPELQPFLNALSEKTRAAREKEDAATQREQQAKAEAEEKRRTKDALERLALEVDRAIAAIEEGADAPSLGADVTALPALEPLLASLAMTAAATRKKEAEATKARQDAEKELQAAREAAIQTGETAKLDAFYIRSDAKRAAEADADLIRTKLNKETMAALEERDAYAKNRQAEAKALADMILALETMDITLDADGAPLGDGGRLDFTALGVFGPSLARLGRAVASASAAREDAKESMTVLDDLYKQHRLWEDSFWKQCGQHMPPELALMVGDRRGMLTRTKKRLEAELRRKDDDRAPDPEDSGPGGP